MGKTPWPINAGDDRRSILNGHEKGILWGSNLIRDLKAAQEVLPPVHR
jgi:hypothetical protein